MVAALLLAGCTLPAAEEAVPDESSGTSATTTPEVSFDAEVDDVRREVWFVPVTEPGFDGPEPDEGVAVAVFPIAPDGTFDGEAPTGEWRPCVRQEQRRVFCSDGTIDVPGEGVRIDLEIGDGYIGFDLR